MTGWVYPPLLKKTRCFFVTFGKADVAWTIIILFHGHRAVPVFTFAEDSFCFCFVQCEDIDIVLLFQ